MSSSIDTLELMDKPVDYLYDQREIEAIERAMPIDKLAAHYATYKMESKKGIYIHFMLDLTPWSTRRTALWNIYHVHHTRKLHPLEYEELTYNYGRYNRRFIVWDYRHIENLIEDDAKYGIVTPQSFVDLCKSRGYSRKQLKLF